MRIFQLKLLHPFLWACAALLTLLFVYEIKNLLHRGPVTPLHTSQTTLSDCCLFQVNATHWYMPTNQEEETEFPLAFSLVVFTDSERVLRLIRAIYRPHNYYCIHIDRKSSSAFVRQVECLRNCRGLTRNVHFVESADRIDVQWGRISVLDADLTCARILLERVQARWKYWINLTGHEFPLRTNWELVRALRLLNGTNLVEAIHQRRNMERIPPPSGSDPLNVSRNFLFSVDISNLSINNGLTFLSNQDDIHTTQNQQF